MKIIEDVALEVLREHERQTNCNVALGGYGMDKFSPLREVRIVRAILEESDTKRLFLLGMFGNRTKGQSCQIADVLPDLAASMDRVNSFARERFDVRLHPEKA